MRNSSRPPVLLLSAILMITACASESPPVLASVIRTHFTPDPESFGNVLVISVAGDYQARAALERQIVENVVSGAVSASAYYTVVGRRPQLSRALLEDAIRARSFDAVLLVRLKGQEQPELAPGRPVGRNFDLFGYDYLELNRDTRLRNAGTFTFVSEIYSSASRDKVWAIESLSFDKPDADAQLREQGFTIARQLRRDGVLAR